MVESLRGGIVVLIFVFVFFFLLIVYFIIELKLYSRVHNFSCIRRIEAIILNF